MPNYQKMKFDKSKVQNAIAILDEEGNFVDDKLMPKRLLTMSFYDEQHKCPTIIKIKFVTFEQLKSQVATFIGELGVEEGEKQ